MAVDAGVHRGGEVDLHAAALQVLLAVGAQLRADLGKDLVGGVDEDEAHVLAGHVVVVLGRVAGHVLDLADGLGAREAAADEDEGERLAADVLVVRGVGLVELLEDVVAQADGLLDALHADALLGEAGDREGAGDRAERDHQVVEGQLVRLADQRGDRGDLAVLVDGGDPAGENLRLGQHASQRDDDVARGDVAGGGFGEEGLVGHVRPGVDDRDGRLAVAHLLEDAPSCVQAYVPTAYYEDPGTLRGAHAIEYPPASGGSLVRPFTSSCRGCVILRDPRDAGHGRPRGTSERYVPLSMPRELPLRARKVVVRPSERLSAGDPLAHPHLPLLNAFTGHTDPRKGQPGALSCFQPGRIPCEELHELSRRRVAEGPRRPLEPRSYAIRPAHPRATTVTRDLGDRPRDAVEDVVLAHHDLRRPDPLHDREQYEGARAR